MQICVLKKSFVGHSERRSLKPELRTDGGVICPRPFNMYTVYLSRCYVSCRHCFSSLTARDGKVRFTG